MAEIHFMISTPILVLGEEVVFGTDDFALEIGRQSGMVLGKPYICQPCVR